ncbi:MAG: leucine-rich repeat domain-containing protein [Saprospiraceae bacterium]|nr:leucine-rich repeat domain-containing protein [Saprospiraceae bacterium]
MRNRNTLLNQIGNTQNLQSTFRLAFLFIKSLFYFNSFLGKGWIKFKVWLLSQNKQSKITKPIYSFWRRIILALFISFSVAKPATYAQVNVQDSLALVAFYHATNGPYCTDSWNLNEPVYTWPGVAADSAGRIISLSGADCTGLIPSEIGNLVHLQSLDLYGNLTGSIPTEIGNLVNLQSLYLNGNLTGSIPTEIGNLTDLQNLSINNTQLSGPIPSQIGNLTKLQYLGLFGNRLSGSIPTQIGNLTKLQNLDLAYNQLSGSIPTQVGNLTKLQHLNLGANQLSGFIPTSIGNLTVLEYLYLGYSGSDIGNLLSGSIPSAIGDLTNLLYLDLSNNQLESIPVEIGNLTKLEFLSLDQNQVSGPIPTSVGNMTNLQRLFLRNNQLSGSIPTRIGDMTNLYALDLSYNQLSGSLPVEIGNLKKLEFLYSNHNQLSGSIPTIIGNMTNLRDLYLSENQLSGCIPTSIGNMTNAQFINLSSNQLSGFLPPTIGNLPNIICLGAYRNNLSGCFPTEYLNLCNSACVAFFGNPNLEDFNDFCAGTISSCETFNFLISHLRNIPDNVKYSSDKTIDSIHSGNTGYFSVAADGSEASWFEITKDGLSSVNVSDINLKIEENEIVSDPDVNGLLLYDGIANNKIRFNYRHPEFVSLAPNQLYKEVHVVVEKFSTGEELARYPIRIYRAPVLMIHGLWSEGTAFNNMYDRLFASGNYSSFQLKWGVYKFTNDQEFDANYYRIYGWINELIDVMASKKIACSEVDIVTHSMGGLLSRLYLSNSLYPKNINKLITINTPHSGTQMANLLLDNTCLKPLFSSVIKFPNSGSTEAGAIGDMQIDHNPIDDMTTHATSVGTPKHAISTTFPIDLVLANTSQQLQNVPFLRVLTLPLSMIRIILAQTFNGEQNDIAVPLSSQLGGLNSPYVTSISNQLHIGSQANLTVINTVSNLLSVSPRDQSQFTTSPFSPPDLTYTTPIILGFGCEVLNNSTQNQRNNVSSVEIITPLTASGYNPGDTIHFNITGSAIDEITLLLEGCGENLYRSDTTGTALVSHWVVDTCSFGERNIIAMGYDSTNKILVFDTIHIMIQPDLFIDSIALGPNPLLLSEGEQYSLDIHAVSLVDSTFADMAQLEGLTYSFTNGNASFFEKGVIKADLPGSDSLVVSYNGIVSNAIEIQIQSFCFDTLVINDHPITSKVYKSSGKINSGGAVADSVSFQSETEINLNSGFEVSTPAAFQARISDCECAINQLNLQINIFDNNTPDVPEDDTYNFTINPQGIGLGPRYAIGGDITMTGLSYGQPVLMNNNGANFSVLLNPLFIQVSDVDQPDCVFETLVSGLGLPSSCSKPNKTAQERLDCGETPCDIFNSGIPLDSLYGKIYAGGLIFYLNTTTCTGLVAAFADQNSGPWGCHGTDLSNVPNVTSGPSGPGADIGDGESNTDEIFTECAEVGIAAKIARNYGNGSYWFLPSAHELNEMYLKIGPGAPAPNKNIGGFASDYYWSSTEYDLYDAWLQYFGISNGNQYNSYTDFDGRVRAVRAF